MLPHDPALAAGLAVVVAAAPVLELLTLELELDVRELLPQAASTNTAAGIATSTSSFFMASISLSSTPGRRAALYPKRVRGATRANVSNFGPAKLGTVLVRSTEPNRGEP
jgi:hypothetical protein